MIDNNKDTFEYREMSTQKDKVYLGVTKPRAACWGDTRKTKEGYESTKPRKRKRKPKKF